MLNMLKTHLDEKGVFSGEMNPFIGDLVRTVDGNVSEKMKLSIAVAEAILYASQFRKYIYFSDDPTPIPINMIAFVLAESGANKDRTVKAVRSSFKNGYAKIEIERKKLATAAAIKQAKDEDVEDPDKWENHKEFYKKPAALFAALTNPAAYIDHLAGTERLPIGAGYLYTGELGSELETNPDIIPSIKVMSEVYDVGYKEPKPLKDKGAETPEISNLAVSALFIGSHENLLYDEGIKRKFKNEFSTKLARRSFFTFSPEVILPPTYNSIEETFRMKAKIKAQSKKAKASLITQVDAIADYNLGTLIGGEQSTLTVSEEVEELYEIYTMYNDELSRMVPKRFPISVLVRKHSQWKALKLAGAFAILNCQTEITKENFTHAVSYIELIYDDMAKFEVELVKEKYEVFCDYMKSQVTGDKSSISLHLLKKQGYIVGTGNMYTKMKELIDLATSYDTEGLYTIKDNSIHYELLEKTDVTGASYVEVSGTKKDRAAQCAAGYEYAETVFENLASLLQQDIAFTPFELKDGIRGRENITGGTTWICFDVDDSRLKAEEVHYILSDVNHHIALTSDPDNEFKFRVIVQLDATVAISNIEWKFFIESVSEELGLPIDSLPQSQIFFGYEGREVLSVIDESPIEVKEHLTYAITKVSEKTPEKELTPKEKSAKLGSPYTTFEKAFNAPNGKGSRYLYGAAYKSFKLGATADETISLIHSISSYWDSPFPAHRLASLEKQIREFA